MMPPFAEVRHYVEGAWRLARGDAGGMTHFDCTVDGFWRSFWAAFYVLPAYALLVADQHARADRATGFVAIVIGEGLVYVLGWLVMPVLAIFLTRFFGLQRHYVPLIVALNWASLVQIGILLVPLALGVLLAPSLAALLMLLASGAVLVYKTFVARVALDTTIGTAASFMAAELVIMLMVTGWLYGVFFD